MEEREIVVNELAQGLRSMPQGVAWFEGLPEEEQRLMVDRLPHRRVRHCRGEAHLPVSAPHKHLRRNDGRHESQSCG
jgi:hypothetical protein